MLIYTIENICFASWSLWSASEWKLFLCLLWKLFETDAICCCFVTLLKLLCQSSRSESCSFACYESSKSNLRQTQFVAALSPCWNCYASHQDLKAVPLLHHWKLFETSTIYYCIVTWLKLLCKSSRSESCSFACYTLESYLRQTCFCCYFSLKLLQQSSWSESCSFACHTSENYLTQTCFVATLCIIKI